MDIENIRCGACGTVGACVPLGDMGSLKWFRCQACGMDVSVHKRTPTVRKGALKLGSRMRSIPLEEGERGNPSQEAERLVQSLVKEYPLPVFARHLERVSDSRLKEYESALKSYCGFYKAPGARRYLIYTQSEMAGRSRRENPAKGIKFVRMPLEPGWPV